MNSETLYTMTQGELGALAKEIEKIMTKMEDDKKKEICEQKKKEMELKQQEKENRHLVVRDCEKRVQTDVEELICTLDYPYTFLRNGEYKNKPDSIPGQPDEDVGNFPDNVKQYFWIYPGANDEEPWMTLCQLTNDVYVFYKGECDYTGFDCQGSMELYASKNLEILIQYAMSTTDYEKYIKDTKRM